MSSSKENLPVSTNKPEHSLTVGNQQIDLSHLPEADRIQLQKKMIEGQIDLQRKMIELGLENQAMDKRIGDITDKVATAAKDGTSATITGAYKDSLGHTEVIVGNTETAAKGKLTRSQTGEKDMTVWYIAIAAVVIVIVALVMR